MAGPRRYGADVDIIPAKGGMGPGGIGAGNIPATRTLTKAELDAAMKDFEAKGGNIQKVEPNVAKDRAGQMGKGLTPSDLLEQSKQKPGLGYYEANMKKGGKVSSASKRADGCAIRGKTRA